MITVEKAKELLFAKIKRAEATTVSISEAFGFVLAEDIFSPIDLPLFNQSSMDGYAISTPSKDQKQFEVVGEIRAGDDNHFDLKEGEAARIYTGASVPPNADCVVIQEKVSQSNGTISLAGSFKKGDFIRVKGSQIKKGDFALKKDSLLNPASIGFLALLGIAKVKVYAKPVISILVTGDEIVIPGNDLHAGQVYESNSFSLHAALQQMRITVKNILMSRDDKVALKKQLDKCWQDSDIILITGGISVGKYDFVHEVLKESGVESIFYKVSQKPGKPFLAGKRNDKLIFALPGNPASVLVCFYEYVFPAIRMMQGFENAGLRSVKLKMLKDFVKKEDRALFIRAKRTGDGVMPLEGQDSAMLRTFAEADSLIYIPMEKQQINKDEMVEVHLLPFEN